MCHIGSPGTQSPKSPSTPTNGQDNAEAISGDYSPVRKGNFTEHWLGKTCFYEYCSEPPASGSSSKFLGKRKVQDDGTLQEIAEKRFLHPDVEKVAETGNKDGSVPPQTATKSPFSRQNCQYALSKMKGVAISEAHRNPAPEYAEDYVMEQFTIEEGGTSTPPFSPLLKRNIPLSIPGKN